MVELTRITVDFNANEIYELGAIILALLPLPAKRDDDRRALGRIALWQGPPDAVREEPR